MNFIFTSQIETMFDANAMVYVCEPYYKQELCSQMVSLVYYLHQILPQVLSNYGHFNDYNFYGLRVAHVYWNYLDAVSKIYS